MKPLDKQSTSISPGRQVDQLFARVRALRDNSTFFCGENESDLQEQKQTLAWKSLVNRSCGDSLTMAIQSDDSRLLKLVFSGFCCTLCHAAAEIICRSFDDLFKQRTDVLEPPKELASIQSAISNMPARKKCAELPWQIATELIKAFGNATDSAPILEQGIQQQ